MAEKMTLKPCPFCGGEAVAENYIVEAQAVCLGCRAKIVRSHGAHTDNGLQEAIEAWNRRARLAQPSQAVDCPACEGRPASGNSPCHVCGKSAQADGWKVPEGCIPVPRSIVERWASVDAFNAPVGAAMELKTVAAQMLIHADMITAPPRPEE